MQVLNPLKQDTVILENFRKMMTDFSFLKKNRIDYSVHCSDF